MADAPTRGPILIKSKVRLKAYFSAFSIKMHWTSTNSKRSLGCFKNYLLAPKMGHVSKQLFLVASVVDHLQASLDL